MKAISIVATLSVSLTACMVGEDEPGTSDEAILGGTTDNGDPSVVQIRYTTNDLGKSACTATVIAPRVLLTAAHCADGFNYEYNPSTTANPFGPSTGWLPAGYASANPSYNGDTHAGYDVGVVILWSPTTQPVSAFGATPAVGATVRAVGYGLMQPSTSGPVGIKQTKSFPVSSVSAHEFVAGPNETCHGDSGGPIFDTANHLVGTTSYGDTVSCNGNDHFMRIDDNRAWIDQQIAFAQW